MEMGGFGWRWLGFSGFQWGWIVVVEIGVGFGFVFTGLVVGGVFLGFHRGGWSVVVVEIGVAVEISVAVFVFRRWRCPSEFGFVFVVFFFIYFLCQFVCLFLEFIGFDLLEVYGFDFLD